MPVIIDGTTGITTPGETNTGNLSVTGSTTLTTPLPVASGGTGATSLSGITTGTSTNLAGGGANTVVYQSATGTTAYLTNGTTGQFLAATTSGAPSWGTVSAGFTLGTPVASTSGSSITFTGIPSGTKQIIIMLNEVSTGGSDPLCIRIGDSGGIETSGYTGFACSMGGSNTTQIGSSANSYQIESASPAVSGYTRSGNIVLNLQDSSDYTWILSGTIKGSGPFVSVSAGKKSLSAVLDRVSVSSTSTFDSFSAGEINIAYI